MCMDFVEKPGDCFRNPSSSPKVNLMEERKRDFHIALAIFVCFSRLKVSFVVNDESEKERERFVT